MIRTTVLAAALALTASATTAFAACDAKVAGTCATSLSTQSLAGLGGAAGGLSPEDIALAGFVFVMAILIASDSKSGSH